MAKHIPQSPCQGGKRQTLVMWQPKGGGAYEQPRRGTELPASAGQWGEKAGKKATQMLPKQAGMILDGDPPPGLSLIQPLPVPGGTFLSASTGSPLPGSTRSDHNATYNWRSVFRNSEKKKNNLVGGGTT